MNGDDWEERVYVLVLAFLAVVLVGLALIITFPRSTSPARPPATSSYAGEASPTWCTCACPAVVQTGGEL